MALTGTQVLQHIEHTLGGTPGGLVGGLEIINDAGQILTNMRPWKYLEGARASLDFTASQSYVALPSDFRDLIAVERQGGFTGSFDLVSHQELLDLVANSSDAATFRFWGAVTFTQSASGAAPVPRIDLFPTPDASVSDGILIYYRSSWLRIETDTQLLNIPEWVEPLYKQVVRAVARGYVEEDVAPLDARLGVIRAGPVFADAVGRDVEIQPSYGQLKNGMARGNLWYRNFEGAVSDP